MICLFVQDQDKRTEGMRDDCSISLIKRYYFKKTLFT
ncbi:hypothetical protein PARMER_01781 [Parabacteroides merdae ATCC 43184]|nr:hypothetical protein PARMER_01781 [Parabacteroides merdae ATCC 43184]